MPGNGVVGNGPITCDNQSADTDDDWNPGDFVTLNTSTHTYEIDETFWQMILANPNQLLYDSARVDWVGYPRFRGVATDDFAYKIGFRTGDKVLSVNSYPLTSSDELGAAFGALYNATSFTVSVYRPGTGTITLQHAIQ